jgi:biotin carboxyl carrier protein
LALGQLLGTVAGWTVKYSVTVGEQCFEVDVDHEGLVRVDGRALYVDMEQVGGLPVYSLALDGAGYVLFVEPVQGGYQVEVRGQVYPVEVRVRRPQLGQRQTRASECQGRQVMVEAPLAGRLLSLAVAEGERVAAGQVVAVVESMKMQMALRAPVDGAVRALQGPAQRDVCQGETLVSLVVTEKDGRDD